MIRLTTSGSFYNTERFLNRATKMDIRSILHRYGKEGVAALRAATPIDSGNTANSWSYQIEDAHGQKIIRWTNSNVNNGVPIAIILQYGHGTKNGGYVQGIDYINPALRKIFDNIAEDAWREVTGV